MPIEVEIATGRHEEHPQTKIGYEYIIKNVWAMSGDEESDEWYDTESEAAIAAENRIDEILDGCDQEPDYDVQPYGQIDWDERIKMGE